MADRMQTLMTDVLGYQKYGVGAADYGALVAARLGHKYVDSSTASTSPRTCRRRCSRGTATGT
ncbi:hypothetical protein GCM10027614_71140 [Micromonospora vulcania]